MSASWDQTFRGQAWAEKICQWEWMYISAALLIPFVQVPAFSQFGKLALLSSCSSIYMVIVYLMTIAVNGAYSAGTAPSDDALNDALWSDAAMTSANASSAAAIDGGGLCARTTMCSRLCARRRRHVVHDPRDAGVDLEHGVHLRGARHLPRADPRDEPADHFGFAFNVLYALAVPFYMLCATVGFWAFGNMASANQVENLQDGLAVHIALYAGLVTTFPVIVLGQVVLMLAVELPLGILPNDFLTNTSSAHLESRVAAALRPFPPFAVRFVWRTAYVGSLLFWAQALVGAGLAFYVNIAGSLGLAAMTYWLPYVRARAHGGSRRAASARYATPTPTAPTAAPTSSTPAAPRRAVRRRRRRARAPPYAVAAVGLFISGCGRTSTSRGSPTRATSALHRAAARARTSGATTCGTCRSTRTRPPTRPSSSAAARTARPAAREKGEAHGRERREGWRAWLDDHAPFARCVRAVLRAMLRVMGIA